MSFSVEANPPALFMETKDEHAGCEERERELEEKIESLREEIDGLEEIISEIKALVA